MRKSQIGILWGMQKKTDLSIVGHAKKPNWCIIGYAKNPISVILEYTNFDLKLQDKMIIIFCIITGCKQC